MNKARSWDPHPDQLSPASAVWANGDPAPWDPVLPGGLEDHLGGLTTAGPWSQSKKPKNADPHDPCQETASVVPSWPQTRLFPSVAQASGRGLQGTVWEEEQRPLTHPEEF